MIHVTDLAMRYGQLQALDGLSLESEPGEVLAMLGPNGAGKSTTIKSIVGLIRPQAGRIEVGGVDALARPREARRLIGYLPQRVAFYDNLTAREVLRFFAQLRGADAKQIDPLLTRVGLEAAADRKTAGFSGGMLQRLGFAAALLGNPPVLILDEPTVGLDPEGTMLFKAIIRERQQAGATILLSSHLLSEVQALADRVAICVKGRVVACDTLERLRANLALPTRMTLRLVNTNGHTEALALSAGAKQANFESGVLDVLVTNETKAGLIRTLEADGIGIQDLRTEEPSLEEIFLAYVHQSP